MNKKINLHAGHNPAGKVGCGAVSVLNESIENRRVVEVLERLFKKVGYTVYNTTVDDGTSQMDILRKICNKSNSTDADLNISIHFNSGANDKKGNGNTTGTECWVYDKTSETAKIASRICKEIEKLGFRNRGVKESKSLYVLKHTKKPAILIECCFVDDIDDALRYNYMKMADAIFTGITGYRSEAKAEEKKEDNREDTKITTYTVKAGTFKNKENAEYIKEKLNKQGIDAIVVVNK